MILTEKEIQVELNRGMLRHCTPLRNFLYGALLYLVMLILAPVTINAEYDFSAACYIIFCSLAFIGGCVVIPAPSLSEEAFVTYSAAQLKKIATILFALSVIATLAKFYDTFFIRDLSASRNAYENREASTGGSANPVAVVAAFFMYAPYLLLALMFCFEKQFRWIEKLFIWAMFGAQFFYPVLVGSRSGLLFPLVFLVLLCLYFRKIKLRFNLKTIVVAIVVLIVGCTVAGKMYSTRIFIINPHAVVADASRSEEGASATVPANETVYNLIYNSEDIPLVPDFLVGYVNIFQYYLHGFFEFPVQKRHVDTVLRRHTNGAYMFGIYIKFFDAVLGNRGSKIRMSAFAHPGIFNSVFGPIYTDFGWFGIIVMFLWGCIQKAVWLSVYRTGNIILLPWVFLGGMIIFLFPLLNLFPGPLCYAFTFIIVMYFLFPQQKPAAEPEDAAAQTARED